eukprot:GDKI01033740.1.p1 GENE.GDKI01033740.1~~GDKI01033740.1.p1  ORF type:complete len:174 (-),score=15.33 GDKI01033740.1:27-548(-)
MEECSDTHVSGSSSSSSNCVFAHNGPIHTCPAAVRILALDSRPVEKLQCIVKINDGHPEDIVNMLEQCAELLTHTTHLSIQLRHSEKDGWRHTFGVIWAEMVHDRTRTQRRQSDPSTATTETSGMCMWFVFQGGGGNVFRLYIRSRIVVAHVGGETHTPVTKCTIAGILRKRI